MKKMQGNSFQTNRTNPHGLISPSGPVQARSTSGGLAYSASSPLGRILAVDHGPPTQTTTLLAGSAVYQSGLFTTALHHDVILAPHAKLITTMQTMECAFVSVCEEFHMSE